MQLKTNYTFFIKKITKSLITIYDDVDNSEYIITNKILEEHFTHINARTIDSSQGTTISTKMTIFDVGLYFMSRAHIWVALTRNVSLDNVYIFLHDDEEKERFSKSRMMLYLREKVKGYVIQDNNANRVIDEKNYVDADFIMNSLMDCDYKCQICSS